MPEPRRCGIVYAPDQTVYPASLLIRDGRVIDPLSSRDMVTSVFVEDGIVKSVGSETPEAERVIDAKGKWVVPGLVDMHVHLREPGLEDRETILSGTKSASAGGFTTIACMPDTNPPLDEEAKIRYVIQRSESCTCRVLPIGTITKEMKGRELSPMGEMVQAGAIGFSEGVKPVVDSNLMKNALNYCKSFRVPIIAHCEDQSLSHGGHMNEGEVSTRLGLGGIPSIAEEIAVARDTMLAEYTGARLHICHVSTAGAVGIIRSAKKRGVQVTCETCLQYLAFIDEDLEGYDTNLKMNPPLRSRKDRDALIEGILDGTIDILVSDHSPHLNEEKKDVEFEAAAFGVIGMETSLGAALTTLVHTDLIGPAKLVTMMSSVPHSILGIEGGRIEPGCAADITIIDPDLKWTVNPDTFFSKGRNSPFIGHEFRGAAVMTIFDGAIVFERFV